MLTFVQKCMVNTQLLFLLLLLFFQPHVFLRIQKLRRGTAENQSFAGMQKQDSFVLEK